MSKVNIKLKERIDYLEKSNRQLTTEIAELKDINGGQSQFLDKLEHFFLDNGFLLINTKDENLKNELRKLIVDLDLNIPKPVNKVSHLQELTDDEDEHF